MNRLDHDKLLDAIAVLNSIHSKSQQKDRIEITIDNLVDFLKTEVVDG